MRYKLLEGVGGLGQCEFWMGMALYSTDFDCVRPLSVRQYKGINTVFIPSRDPEICHLISLMLQ